MPPVASDDVLPPGRIVRWMLLLGFVLFCVGLYFRHGLNAEPLGSTPPAATTTAPTSAR